MKICIIGGVAGGATAAARLRRLDESAQIVMFERGPYISFANCGLPYHISGAIKERDELLLQTPESFHERFAVDVRTRQEVVAIHRDRHMLTVNCHATGRQYEESYDKLILSPGAEPFIPPMNKADDAMLYTLRNLPDLDQIMTVIAERGVRKALVIGGGFIGVEVAENLCERGIVTQLVELSPQVMAPLDMEMANIVHAELRRKGVTLYLGDAIARLDAHQATLKSGAIIDFDLCISAVGVRPETSLARDASLALGATGGILVDSAMRTADPDIYAVGDAVEIDHFVTKEHGLIPLAGPANKQGRIAADNIAGLTSHYKGTQGSGILKVFGLAAAFTGINERSAKKQGLNYQAIHLHPADHAGYYPGAQQMSLKLLFEKSTGRILGAQAVGPQGVDKRIDVIATAMRAGLTVTDLQDLELCYAPPFGSAKDPVNMAGYIAGNIMAGTSRSITYDRLHEVKEPFLLNVCFPNEWLPDRKIPGATTIPLPELRGSLARLPRDRPIVVSCMVGLRAHVACRILQQEGFGDVYNLSGGYRTFLHYTGG